MQCEYFNMVHGVTLRAIDAFSDGDLDFRPKPVMRTPRELILHVYSQEKILAEAARQESSLRRQPAGPARKIRAVRRRKSRLWSR